MINYCIGVPSPSNKAAALGNVFHKVFETLAWFSVHKGKEGYEDETFGWISLETDLDTIIELSYNHYREVDSHVDWTPKADLKKIIQWVETGLTKWDGYFDPRNQDVIEAELRFDFEIEKPWAHYKYETPDGYLEGNLSVKGTIDLAIRDPHDPDIIELIDYKTGRQFDWVEMVDKDYGKLMKDPQILLYNYAASRLFPGKTIQFTILYVNNDGPFRIHFDSKSITEAERLIKERFELIKNDNKPQLKKSYNWGKECPLCPYTKPSEQDPSRSICKFFEDEIRMKGADKVFFEYGDINKLTRYSDGGGRKAK